MILQIIEMEVAQKLSITDEDIELSGNQAGTTWTAEGTGVSCTTCSCG